MAEAQSSTAVLTYKYKLKPTKAQHEALARILLQQKDLYNAALLERVDAYQKQGKSITLYEQQKSLTIIRSECEGWSSLPVALQRGTVKRLDLSFRSFFRRLKAGEKPGFPRYKSAERFRSFSFSQWTGITLRDGRIRFKGVPGSIRLHLHRPLPEDTPLTCAFTRSSKGWTVNLHYRLSVTCLPSTGRQVGIDVGLTTLAMLSTGEAIPNPRHTKRWERELRRRSRALNRCKRDSNRRRKVKVRVTALHAKIANSRRTYLHQVSTRLVREYDLIAVEKLNTQALARTMLAKGVSDAGWSTLKEMLTYKAERAGRQLVEVDPRHTSQLCSGCGALVPKKLSERWHCCPNCGLQMDRDENAARNILHRAVVRPEPRNVGQWAERAAGNLALDETPV